MKVKMLMRIDVIERESRRSICFELRLDFCRDLPTDQWARENIDPKTHHVLAKTPALIDEIREALRWQDRTALYQHDMEAYAQSRQLAGSRDRILSRRGRNHETGGRQDAVSMGDFDGIIDLAREPKIISGDNNLLQDAGSRRSRRKRKNSTPSRNRRRNISGLVIISPTMAAIFGARK